MAYDIGRAGCVLFGGFSGAASYGDTWEYSSAGTPVTPTTWGKIKVLYGGEEQ